MRNEMTEDTTEVNYIDFDKVFPESKEMLDKTLKDCDDIIEQMNFEQKQGEVKS